MAEMATYVLFMVHTDDDDDDDDNDDDTLIFYSIDETPKGLAMINSAAMHWQLTVKPSYNTSASIKALMVQHPYQAWLPCRLMI